MTQQDLLHAEAAWRREARAMRRTSDLWIVAFLVVFLFVLAGLAVMLWNVAQGGCE